MFDSSFSTALGYMPSAFDNESAVALAIQRAAHNREKAKLPSNAGSLGGLRATGSQEMTASQGLKEALKLYNTWQDSRSGGFDPYDTNFLVARDNAIYGDTFPDGSFGIGSTSGDAISRHVVGHSSIQPDFNAAAGLGSDNNWWGGIKNMWSNVTGGN